MKEFKLKSPYKPLGDQPQAIESLSNGIKKGLCSGMSHYIDFLID